MGTKNISLPEELEEFIEAKVASGQYAHASEVVRDAVRLMMQQEADKLEWLRDAIAAGIADVARGDVLDPDEAFHEAKAQGRAMLKARRKMA
jgi:antitoxin ParD1/3/4